MQQLSQAMDCNNDRLYVPEKDGGFASTADAESSSTECMKGEMVDASQAIEGHGKQAKQENVLYSSMFWLANDGSDGE